MPKFQACGACPCPRFVSSSGHPDGHALSTGAAPLVQPGGPQSSFSDAARRPTDIVLACLGRV